MMLQVDAFAFEPQPAAAVLRLAPLGDVHAGHDFEARDRRVLQMVRDRQDVIEQAVHALPDLQ
jgi:hypothetical protein